MRVKGNAKGARNVGVCGVYGDVGYVRMWGMWGCGVCEDVGVWEM